MRLLSNPRPRRTTPTAIMAALLAGGMLGIIISALAVMLTSKSALDVYEDTCYTNPTGLQVRVLDVTMDTITYGGWYADRYHIWTRGYKHFASYYELTECLEE